MSTIGKGSRFLSLTGPLRGQEGTAHELADGGSWPLMFDNGKVFYFDVATLEGPSFKRLGDAPAPPDPLLVELATVEAERAETWGGPEHDARRDPEEWLELLGDEVRERDDAETPAEIREGLLMIAAIALAGARALDRRATRYAAQLGESERVGQDRIARIRAALLKGAADAEQAWATTEARENVDCGSHSGTLYKMSRAYLALSASHAEAQALLADISARARALLGAAGT